MGVTLATTIKKHRRPAKITTSQTRKDFIKAFEQTFGNISAACEIVGIDRRTYYRWMNSNTRLNRDFRAKLAKLQPAEKLVDFAEAGLMERIQAKDTTAIIFTLKTKGKHRGYIEKQTIEITTDPRIDDLKSRIHARAAEKGIPYEQELAYWNENFSDNVAPEVKEKLCADLGQVG